MWIVTATLSVGLVVGCGEDTSKWQPGTQLYAQVGKDGHVAYQGTIQSRSNDVVVVHNPEWGTQISTYEDTADGLAAKGVYAESTSGSSGTLAWPGWFGLALMGGAAAYWIAERRGRTRSSTSTAFDLGAVMAAKSKPSKEPPPSTWLPPGSSGR